MCWLQPVVVGSLAGDVPPQRPPPPGRRHRDVRRPPPHPRTRHAEHHRVPDAQVILGFLIFKFFQFFIIFTLE